MVALVTGMSILKSITRSFAPSRRADSSSDAGTPCNAVLRIIRFQVDIRPVSYTHLDVYKRQDRRCNVRHAHKLAIAVTIAHYATRNLQVVGKPALHHVAEPFIDAAVARSVYECAALGLYYAGTAAMKVRISSGRTDLG